MMNKAMLPALMGLLSLACPANAQEPADRIRAIQRQIMDLETTARTKVLQDRGIKPLPRPALNTLYNVDEFAPATIRFVRFTILATLDNAPPCIDELEIYGPNGKENLARDGKATASSLLPNDPHHKIDHLNDSKYGNSFSWISNKAGKGWVQIEFPKPVTVSRVVWSRDAVDPPVYHDRLASKYQISVSKDGEYWKTVSTEEGRVLQDRWFSGKQLLKALDADQQKKRQDLLDELNKLRPAKKPVVLQSGPQLGEGISGRFGVRCLSGPLAGKNCCPV